MKTPFETAERYIQLRNRCLSPSWGDRIIFFNEMVLGPLITLFLLFMGSTDIFMVISAVTRAYSAWCDWEEYHSLKSVMDDMFLRMSCNGGPQIRTNDPHYYPYVIADAMVRLNEPRLRPLGHLQHETHTQKQGRSRHGYRNQDL